MAQHGGKRAGAGRKPGAVSKAKRALAEKAKDHADDALRTLVDVMNNTEESGTTRISAANSILDRGFGKPFQGVNPEGDAGDDAPSLNIKITSDAPVKDVRVTRSEG